MNTKQSPAKLVKGYREVIARDPDLYDGDLDIVMWLVNDTPERDWTPSQVAQVVKINSHEAYNHLAELAQGGHIRRDDRGAWTHYWSRLR